VRSIAAAPQFLRVLSFPRFSARPVSFRDDEAAVAAAVSRYLDENPYGP
jgi:hypothetical protein